MRLRHKKNAETDVLFSPLVINTRQVNNILLNEPLDINTIFNNSNPTYIELGMGKGKFITEMAKQNESINFIGIEKSATIVLKAIDNLQIDCNSNISANLNNIKPNDLDTTNSNITSKNQLSAFHNLRFMCEDIINLISIFKPKSIDRIFLNFSDPWPKKRHESRRLTHKKFLSIYENILKPNSLLEFKTDNIDLFNFSLEEIKNSNFSLLEFTYDLHNDAKLNINNIMTEYESKFSSLGNKICKLIAKCK